MPAQGFAVFDTETTGLSSAGADRIVEIAVVHVDAGGAITGRWDTLIDPGRSTGPVEIHRISGRDVALAPTFAQVAPQLVDFLNGRVLVAHNAQFDLRFIRAEFARAGYTMPADPATICTMKLSKRFRVGAASNKLSAACADYGVVLEDAHRAMADTVATAELLAAFMARHPDDPVWAESLAAAAGSVWPSMSWESSDWYRREDAA